jgi:hypothetical protein
MKKGSQVNEKHEQKSPIILRRPDILQVGKFKYFTMDLLLTFKFPKLADKTSFVSSPFPLFASFSVASCS